MMTNAEFLAVPVPHRLVHLGAHVLALRLEVGCLTRSGAPIIARKWLDPHGPPARLSLDQAEALNSAIAAARRELASCASSTC